MFRTGLLSLFMLWFTSCSRDTVYLVDMEFKPYLQSFLQESAKRQQVLEFDKTGLIIEFPKLEGISAGLCHYEKPIRIEIDSLYWKSLSGSSDEDLLKEQLIFHELGYGFLNRNHDNTVLANGDWKSLMRGGTGVNRSYNINYRGMRRAYYIDELFNPQAAVPAFAACACQLDTAAMQEQFYLSFDSEVGAGWLLVDNADSKTSVENGRLRFDSRSDYSYVMLFKTPVDVLSNFVCELTLSCESRNPSSLYGLVFGHRGATNSSLEYVSINNKCNLYVGNFNAYSYYTELFVESILPTRPNVLKIVKNETMLYYFVNNTYIYCTEVDSSLSGRTFGFVVETGVSVWVDNMKIKYKPTAAKEANTKLASSSDRPYSIEKLDYVFAQ